MAAEIVWRHEARADLIAVLDDIAAHDPKAALGYIEEIEKRVGGLAEHPKKAPAYNDSYRMLVVRNHSVFYRHDEDSDKIIITSILYGGRDLETLIGPRDR